MVVVLLDPVVSVVSVATPVVISTVVEVTGAVVPVVALVSVPVVGVAVVDPVLLSLPEPLESVVVGVPGVVEPGGYVVETVTFVSKDAALVPGSLASSPQATVRATRPRKVRG